MFDRFQAESVVASIETPRSGAAVSVSSHATPRIDIRRLMAGQRALVIEHAGQEYHLRLTRNDKLILTK